MHDKFIWKLTETMDEMTINANRIKFQKVNSKF